MDVLDIKLVRDLWSMRTQVLSIALLIGAGVAVLVMSVSNYLALVGAMDAHYRNERFGDLFASVKRAPLALVDRIREIEGVGIVEARIAQAVRVMREDTELPISGRIISIPASGQPQLNRLYLLDGRWIDSARPDEIIIAAYAQAPGVRPGDSVDVILKWAAPGLPGRRHRAVAGIRARDPLRPAASGRSQFRRAVGRRGRGRWRVRHAGRLQRCRPDAGAGSGQGGGHRGARPASDAVRRHRCLRPPRAALEPPP